MSLSAVEKFHFLVGAMRTNEKSFWSTREHKYLVNSKYYEGEVDKIVQKAQASDVPDNDNGKFFLAVAELRLSTKQYFAQPKGTDKKKQLFKKVQEQEKHIDKMLIQFKDQRAKQLGYSVTWNLMQVVRGAKKAVKMLGSEDEAFVKVHLDECIDKPPIPGARYFMCKEYVPTPEKRKKCTPEQIKQEIEQLINQDSNHEAYQL